MRTAIVVAPLSPLQPAMHLGAAKKIELVIGLLQRLGYELHLVDSSHSEARFARALLGRPTSVGTTPVTLWRPSCWRVRKFGKAINVAQASGLAAQMAPLAPAVVWAYNCYSFEARFTLELKRLTGCAAVLELEDLPLARRRSLDPKPLLDAYFFPKLLAAADLVTFVNATFRRRFAAQVRNGLLLPSLLAQSIVDAPTRLRFASTPFVAGYFGGLSVEKGAGVLTAAVQNLPVGWKLVVTGVGELAHELEHLQAGSGGRLEFYGRVSHERLADLMTSCDVIINPHASIESMDDGVFPFKVCEALASGALLISTRLPPIDIDLSKAVLEFDGTPQGLVGALSRAHFHYAQHTDAIQTVRDVVRERFGEAPMRRRLGAELRAIGAA